MLLALQSVILRPAGVVSAPPVAAYAILITVASADEGAFGQAIPALPFRPWQSRRSVAPLSDDVVTAIKAEEGGTNKIPAFSRFRPLVAYGGNESVPPQIPDQPESLPRAIRQPSLRPIWKGVGNEQQPNILDEGSLVRGQQAVTKLRTMRAIAVPGNDPNPPQTPDQPESLPRVLRFLRLRLWWKGTGEDQQPNLIDEAGLCGGQQLLAKWRILRLAGLPGNNPEPPQTPDEPDSLPRILRFLRLRLWWKGTGEDQQPNFIEEHGLAGGQQRLPKLRTFKNAAAIDDNPEPPQVPDQSESLPRAIRLPRIRAWWRGTGEDQQPNPIDEIGLGGGRQPLPKLRAWWKGTGDDQSPVQTPDQPESLPRGLSFLRLRPTWRPIGNDEFIPPPSPSDESNAWPQRLSWKRLIPQALKSGNEQQPFVAPITDEANSPQPRVKFQRFISSIWRTGNDQPIPPPQTTDEAEAQPKLAIFRRWIAIARRGADDQNQVTDDNNAAPRLPRFSLFRPAWRGVGIDQQPVQAPDESEKPPRFQLRRLFQGQRQNISAEEPFLAPSEEFERPSRFQLRRLLWPQQRNVGIDEVSPLPSEEQIERQPRLRRFQLFRRIDQSGREEQSVIEPAPGEKTWPLVRRVWHWIRWRRPSDEFIEPPTFGKPSRLELTATINPRARLAANLNMAASDARVGQRTKLGPKLASDVESDVQLTPRKKLDPKL